MTLRTFCIVMVLIIVLRCASSGATQPEIVSQPVQRFGFGTLEVTAVSPDGTRFASGGGIGVVLWDINTGEVIRILSSPRHYAEAVAFSADGMKIASGGDDRKAILWDVETGEKIVEFVGHTNWVTGVAISPDGALIATGSYDRTVRIWDATTGQQIRSINAHNANVWDVNFSPDGTLLASSALDGTSKLWTVADGSLARSIPHGAFSARFSADGTKLVTSGGIAAKVWNVDTGAELLTLTGHTGYVAMANFSPDASMIATASGDDTARVWNATTGQLLRTLNGHLNDVRSADFTTDGNRLLTGAWDDRARLWDVSTGTLLQTYLGHIGPIAGIATAPDNQTIFAGNQGLNAILWNQKTGEKIREYLGNPDPVIWIQDTAYSSNGVWVLTGSEDKNARMYDLATGIELRTFTGHTGSIEAVAFSPDSTRVLTAGDDGTARIWSVASGATLTTLMHGAAIYDANFSPDGTHLATAGGDDTAKLWDLQTETVVTTFTGHTAAVNAVEFSPDGSRLFTASDDRTARMWDIATGNAQTVFSGHAERIEGLDISPDGLRLVTASDDNDAIIWDVQTGDPLRRLVAHSESVNVAAFTTSGDQVVTGATDGTIMLWDAAVEPPRITDKLILAAGGGTVSNPIANQTHRLAEQAYQVATIRGYTPDNIYYLSSLQTPAQNPKVDEVATGQGVLNAIQNWGADAHRLTIMLLDHGTYNSLTSRWFFLVDAGSNPRDTLAADELDAVLDAMQAGDNPLRDAILYVDMCYAGGFVRECSGAPEGANRLVIASTTDSRLANFGGPNGEVSFTGYFLSSALLGNTFKDCFNSARSAIVSLNIPAGEPQVPWLDDNGDGAPGPTDGVVAARSVFGNLPAFGALTPQITDVRPITFLQDAEDVLIWCETGEEVAPRRVEAVVSWSGQVFANENGNGQPITTQVIVPLAYNFSAARFEAVLTSADLAQPGTYTILYRGVGDDGLGVELFGEPVSGVIVRGNKNSAESVWELYE